MDTCYKLNKVIKTPTNEIVTGMYVYDVFAPFASSENRARSQRRFTQNDEMTLKTEYQSCGLVTESLIDV